MGPLLGTDKRVAKADFRYFDDKHQLRLLGHHPQHHQPVAGAAGLGLLKYHVVGDPRYRGNTLVLQTPHTPRCWSIVRPRSSGW